MKSEEILRRLSPLLAPPLSACFMNTYAWEHSGRIISDERWEWWEMKYVNVEREHIYNSNDSPILLTLKPQWRLLWNTPNNCLIHIIIKERRYLYHTGNYHQCLRHLRSKKILKKNRTKTKKKMSTWVKFSFLVAQYVLGLRKQNRMVISQHLTHEMDVLWESSSFLICGVKI